MLPSTALVAWRTNWFACSRFARAYVLIKIRFQFAFGESCDLVVYGLARGYRLLCDG